MLSFLWQPGFFGLTQEYRVNLFTTLHDLVFHSGGGYDYYTVYNMPIWLRQFTVNKIVEFRQEEKKAMDSAQKGDNSTSANMGDPLPEHMKKAFQDQSKKSSYTTQRAKK